MYQEIYTFQTDHTVIIDGLETDELVLNELEFDDRQFVLLPNFVDVVSRVRSIINFFSRSALATDILRKSCEEKGMKYLSLKVDCVTRWSSLYQMLLKFIQMYAAIEHTYSIMERDLSVDKIEIIIINVIIK